MTQQARISAAASIILHVLGLLILAGVKLYTDRGVESSIPVTFLGQQKTRRLRRSISVRPIASLSNSPKPRSPEQYIVLPERSSPVEFYVSTPERVFSGVKSVGQDVLEDTGVRRPSRDQRQRSLAPMAVETLKEPHLRGSRIQPRLTEGHDLLNSIPLPQEKLDPVAADFALQRFARAVRRKMESKKRYPRAAQRLGIEGSTGVRITILKDGQLEKVEVVDSSGHEILDTAALQSVRDAAPFPPIPEETGLDRIEMSIYFRFGEERKR